MNAGGVAIADRLASLTKDYQSASTRFRIRSLSYLSGRHPANLTLSDSHTELNRKTELNRTELNRKTELNRTELNRNTSYLSGRHPAYLSLTDTRTTKLTTH